MARNAESDELKAAKGNTGHRAKKAQAAPASAAAVPPVKALDVPDFLVHPREREIFCRIVNDNVLRRIARNPDLSAYARWAHYLHRWILCKEALEGKATWYTSASNHGELKRRHPLFKDQLDLERVLQSLEDRIGLNPAARQNIVRGLAALPAALAGLFDDPDEAKDTGSPPHGVLPDAPGEPTSPVGLLNLH